MLWVSSISAVWSWSLYILLFSTNRHAQFPHLCPLVAETFVSASAHSPYSFPFPLLLFLLAFSGLACCTNFPSRGIFVFAWFPSIIWTAISPSLLSNSSLSLIGNCSTMISQTSPSLLLVSCFFFVPINEHARKSHANEKATGIHLNKYGLIVQCSSPLPCA